MAEREAIRDNASRDLGSDAAARLALPRCPMSDEQMTRLVELLRDPAKAEAALPQAERDHYRRCQQSVVDSRRAAERESFQHFVY